MAASTPAKKKPTTASKSSTEAERRKAEREQQEVVKKFLETGVDFTPLTLDAGDGVEWNFTPDPQPAETERLSEAMKSLHEAQSNGDSIVEPYEALKEAIRDRIMDADQREEFPKPYYGVNAIMWFAMRVATGRDGFPTE